MRAKGIGRDTVLSEHTRIVFVVVVVVVERFRRRTDTFCCTTNGGTIALQRPFPDVEHSPATRKPEPCVCVCVFV